MPNDCAKLELPPDLAPIIEITVYQYLEIGPIAIAQSKPEFRDGRWHIDLKLMEAGSQFRVVRPGA